MQRYTSTVTGVSTTTYMAADGEGKYYLAADVDLRIAELEKEIADLKEIVKNCLSRLAQ